MGDGGMAYFATSNTYKFDEYSRLFASHDIALRRVDLDTDELQSMNYLDIAEDKAVDAYRQFGIPIVTEVCGIGLDALDGFPSGLNRKFWQVLGPRVSAVATVVGPEAVATAVLSVCDGRRVHHQYAKVPGRIASSPSTVGSFHLDQIFIPDGASIPLSEMTEAQRDQFSYRGRVSDPTVGVLRSLGVLRHDGQANS